MATVKYSGPVASFHCPTEATIRSLKVHFSPKQLGSGTPSPENVREIVGWDGVEVYQRGKNLLDFGTQTFTTYQRIYLDAPLKPGTYKLSATITSTDTDSTQSLIGFWDKLGGRALSQPILRRNERTSTTVTLAEQCNLIYLYASNSYASGVGDTSTWSEIQLEVESNATNYEPYHGSTTNYEFGVLGKNKFPASDGTTSDIFLAANTTYTISATSPSAGYFKGWYEDETDTGLIWINAGSDGNRRWKTFTPEKNIAKGLIYVGTGMSECQIELGSTATTYEPYDPNHTVYGGWVDLITGEVCEEWSYAKFRWGDVSVNVDLDNYDGKRITLPGLIINATNKNNKFCNIAPFEQAYASDSLHFYTYVSSNVSYARVYLPKNSDDNTIIELAVLLDVPMTYSLAPTQLQTFLGHNNVWSNADYVEIEYDLHETQTILARKQFIIANQPHTVKASGSLVNFETDMAAALKECKVGFKPVQDLHGYDKPWVGGSGKNIFNINAVEQDPDNTTLSNSSARKFTTGTYAKGASYSNYWQAGQIIECTINNNAITVSSTTGYGVGFPIKMKEGTTYFISCTMTGNSSGQINIAPYDVEGNYLGDAVLINYVNQTYTAPANTDIGVIIFRNQTSKNNPISTTFSSIQVEVGTAATSYEPYENICPISGWTGLEVYRTGKNLFPETLLSNYESYYDKGNYGYWYTDPIFLAPNTTYHLGWERLTGEEDPICYWGIKVYPDASYGVNDTGTFQYYCNGANGFRSYTSFTTGTSGAIRFAINPYDNSQTKQTAIEELFAKARFMLNVNATSIAYEPYTGTTIPITFPFEAGTVYGGYVDLVTGEVVQTWISRLGSEMDVQTSSSTDEPWVHRFTVRGPWISAVGYENGSGAFEWDSDKIPHGNAKENVSGLSGSGVLYVYDNTISTVQSFKEKYADTQFVYQLRPAAYKYYTINPQTLKTLRGTNNIWSNANGNIELSYWKH